MVFNNFDDPKAFERHSINYYIPTRKHTYILFTSRYTDLKRLGRQIEVFDISKYESLNI